MMLNRDIDYGQPNPMGATWWGNGFNFALYAKEATEVTLLLFTEDNFLDFYLVYNLDPITNKTGPVWHCYMPAQLIGVAKYYGYMVDGPAAPNNHFVPAKILLDPWAKGVFFPPTYSRQAAYGKVSNMGMAPLGCLVKEIPGDPVCNNKIKHHHDLIIYEMHVRGFTMHESSGVDEERRGTFLGIVDKIPYLKELGVTALELMPVHQFDPQEGNYWGYMTVNFFAPHATYCLSQTAEEQLLEFKQMVQALHEADIEVLLDVVYNHTVEEGRQGPTFSYRGIDNEAYYLMDDYNENVNDTGTGNTLRTAHRVVRQLILDNMRYWVQEMGVDGFRFDLASIFTRDDNGCINTHCPALIEEISMDPLLSGIRLIAEPWDIASYQLGTTFPGRGWSQWNDKYRDDIRRLVKGDSNMIARLMARMYGSDDLFPHQLPYSCHPFQSLNFITAHDGFSLYDLVSFNHKRNYANGYNNEDGTNENNSWNCGYEGVENVPAAVELLRLQQAKNFVTILMLSNGIPMLSMGDEFLHTHLGNNNPYNQDNEINWLNWERKEEFGEMFRYFKNIIEFRKIHPSIGRRTYWAKDVKWYGARGKTDISEHSHSLAFYLDGSKHNDSDLYVMINAWWEPLEFTIQEGEPDDWCKVVNTAADSPNDIDLQSDNFTTSYVYGVEPRSVVVLERRR
jgi:glycogen operon protein